MKAHVAAAADATPARIGRSTIAANLGLLFLVCLAIVPRPAAAQNLPTSLPGEPPLAVEIVARRFGLCQCLDDKASVTLRCMAGTAACEGSCGSTHYAFVPLGSDALRRCEPNELYVVLPNADGRPGSGAISVEQGGTSTLLDQPYAAAATRGKRSGTIDVGASEVQTIFQHALAARPMLPSRFVLLFPLGGTQPLPDSALEYRKILDDIKKRPVYEVQVIGYTDTLADPGFDQRLGMQRAEGVRRALIRDGVADTAIAVASRGKTDLLVPTGDQVAEQRNRRVEVTVR